MLTHVKLVVTQLTSNREGLTGTNGTLPTAQYRPVGIWTPTGPQLRQLDPPAVLQQAPQAVEAA
jgi:hypothetical protein